MPTAWVSPGAAATGSTAASLAFSYTPHKAGNVLMLASAEYRATTQATAVSTPTDTAGNVWSAITPLITDGVSGSSSAGRARVYGTVVNGTSAITITCPFSGGSGTASTVVLLDEISGANFPVDAQNSAAATGTAPTPGSITPGQNNDILWAFVIGNVSSSPGGWTTRQNTTGFVTSTQQLSGGAGGSQSITYSQTNQGYLTAIVALSPFIADRPFLLTQAVMRAALWTTGA